jgi:hypothetical protein
MPPFFSQDSPLGACIPAHATQGEGNMDSRRTWLAIMLNALPIVTGLILLVSSTYCLLPGDLPGEESCYSVFSGWTVAGQLGSGPAAVMWLLLAVCLAGAVWGLGYWLTPTTPLLVGLFTPIAGLAVNIVTFVLWMLNDYYIAELALGHPDAAVLRDLAISQANRWVWWGVLNLLAGSVTTAHVALLHRRLRRDHLTR